jgi:hypothetical protein
VIRSCIFDVDGVGSVLIPCDSCGCSDVLDHLDVVKHTRLLFWLTLTFSEQIFNQCLGDLVPPWTSTWSFFICLRRRQTTQSSIVRCMPLQLHLVTYNRCFARYFARLFASLMLSLPPPAEFVINGGVVGSTLFVWSRDLGVNLSSWEDFYVNLLS